MPSYRPAKPRHDHAACGHDHHHGQSHDHAHQPEPAAEPAAALDAGSHDCCGSTAVAPLNGARQADTTLSLPAGSIRSQLRIAQMDCPTEEALIRKKLGGMLEVQGLDFNLMQRVLTVVHGVSALPAIEAAIR